MLVVTAAACLAHDPGRSMPEQPARLRAVLQRLAAAGIPVSEAPAASAESLATLHDPEYLRDLEAMSRRGAGDYGPDCPVGPDTWRATLAAAGAAQAALAHALDGRGHAFAAIRPPGHHALRHEAMGFCYANHVALLAAEARRQGRDRVLIIDWDVHHGNGTQDTFYRDASVYYFSTHQSPLYPGTGHPLERGEGPGLGTTMNWPLRAGAGRREIMAAFEQGLLPEADAFKPDLVVVSAGFDARHGDPLGGLRLTDDDFHDLTLLVRGIAERHSGGRLVSVLEGGYDLAGLGLAAVAHVRGLLAEPAGS